MILHFLIWREFFFKNAKRKKGQIIFHIFVSFVLCVSSWLMMKGEIVSQLDDQWESGDMTITIHKKYQTWFDISCPLASSRSISWSWHDGQFWCFQPQQWWGWQTATATATDFLYSQLKYELLCKHQFGLNDLQWNQDFYCLLIFCPPGEVWVNHRQSQSVSDLWAQYQNRTRK